jgi:hypothetical protein
MFPLSSAHACNREREKYDESCQRVEEKERAREAEKEQQRICIYLCCCLYVDQASLLLSLMSSIVIDSRKYFFVDLVNYSL